MASKARDYKLSTLKRLHTLSGNQCAAPGCSKTMIARDGVSIVGKICHIEAASPEGPRYNPDMTDEDRRHFQNLILLCDECHSIIDNKENIEKYPVQRLKKWKKDHETMHTYIIANKNPPLLGIVIDAISSANLEDLEPEKRDSAQPFSIEEKIQINNLSRNAPLIQEYKIFYTKLNTIYQELEKQGSFKKERLLRHIRQQYVQTKGQYIGNSSEPLTAIRHHSDSIFEDVQDKILEMAERKVTGYAEDLSFGVALITVDAFMRCKILEEPQ